MAKQNGNTEERVLERKPVEAWRDELGTPAWLFAAAQAKYGWPQGRELTKDEYLEAIQSTEKEVIR